MDSYPVVYIVTSNPDVQAAIKNWATRAQRKAQAVGRRVSNSWLPLA
jgi:hypothetical protein